MNSPFAGYWSDGDLLLHYRGVTLRLEAGDARLPVIELLLFGKTLPSPFPAPAEPVAACAEPVADVAVPPAWMRLWKSLPDLQRRTLVLLSRETLTAPEFETRLGLPAEGLRAVNIVVAHRARKVELKLPVEGIGRGRDGRRYFVVEEARGWVLELARRSAQAAEAMEGDA